MRQCTRTVVLSITIAVLCSMVARAQLLPGEAIIVAKNNSSSPAVLQSVGVGGQVTTLYTGTPNDLFAYVEMAPGNRGVFFSHEGQPFFPASILRFDRSGLTTVWTSSDLIGITDLDIDQGGDVLALTTLGREQTLLRRDAATRTVTTVWNRRTTSVSYTFGLEEDLLTGDWLFCTTTNELLRITPSGAVTTVPITLPSNVFAIRRGYVQTDFDDGALLVNFGQGLSKIDPLTGATVALRYSTLRTHYNSGIDADPYGQDYYHLDGAFPLMLTRYDAGQNQVTTLNPLSTRGYDVVSFGGRHISALGDRPNEGTTFRLRVAFPGEPNQPYIVTASTGALNGFRLPDTRRVPQDLVPLFYFSLVPNPIFLNFQGRLDIDASADVSIAIPAGTAGLRIYLCAVTLNGTGVQTISLPYGLRVEP